MNENLYIAYFRLSKDEKTSDLTKQIDLVLDKFDLRGLEVIKNPEIKDILPSDTKLYFFEEKGSAYDLEKINKRKEFLKILNFLFPISKTLDLYLAKNRDFKTTIYAFDPDRITRNFEHNLQFGLLCDLFNVELKSAKHYIVPKKEEETPAEKLSRYLIYSISAFSAEDYSWNISKNVRKGVVKTDVRTESDKGKKWGRNFTDGSIDEDTGKKRIIRLEREEEEKMLNLIVKMLKKGEYGSDIIYEVKERFGVLISNSYLTKVRKRYVTQK